MIPPDRAHQVYVTVRPILSGSIFLPTLLVFEDSKGLPKEEGSRVPVFCFLITHPTQGHSLFDLGLRKHGKGYPPHLDEMIFTIFQTECEHDVAESLSKGGVKPQEIKNVILSHLHWDHAGDPSPFVSANIVLGAEAIAPLADEVYPKNPTGTVSELPEGRHVEFIDYASSSRPAVAPFGPFERAVDFCGDGSLYLVDAPGHFPGHLAAMARVAPNTFVFLGGDLCYNRQCYTPGTRLPSGISHRDVPKAWKTTQQLVTLNKELDGLVVILGHETERLEEQLPLFPDDIHDWVLQQVEARLAAREL